MVTMPPIPVYDPKGTGRWVKPARPWWRTRGFWMVVCVLLCVVLLAATAWFLIFGA
ncbi:MAG: hypothetical protein HY301_11900 [Verrucomicrobia bacterium]|nr:hypothetical protein [Verrucomicrobiota bacterium]